MAGEPDVRPGDRRTWPRHFRPNRTPEECIKAGIFGGTYFGDARLIDVAEFPSEWFDGLEDGQYRSERYDVEVNRYGVKAGTSQAEWEAQGWMHEDDPRGWFQWYCRYWLGRRHEDDDRQVERWVRFASVEHGRWTNILFGRLASRRDVDDERLGPVIRQSLLHWAYVPTKEDYDTWRAAR